MKVIFTAIYVLVWPVLLLISLPFRLIVRLGENDVQREKRKWDKVRRREDRDRLIAEDRERRRQEG